MTDLIANKAQFAVGTYEDGSGPIATIAYDTTSQYTPSSVWVYGGDGNGASWVAFDWRYADAIADAIKEAAAALRARASMETGTHHGK
jgi:hypothetical protein